MTLHVDSEVGTAATGDPAPAGPGAEAADADQQGRVPLRRRAVGQAGQAGARRVRRGAARPAASRCTCFDELLARDRGDPGGPKYILDASFDERVYGPMALDTLHSAFDADGRRRADRPPHRRHDQARAARADRGAGLGASFQALDLDDFLLPPLPNHLFTRDTSAWIYDGVSINAMRKRARMRETIHYEAIYRWHPLFADADFHVWSEGSAAAWPPPRAATSSSSAAAPYWSG